MTAAEAAGHPKTTPEKPVSEKPATPAAPAGSAGASAAAATTTTVSPTPEAPLGEVDVRNLQNKFNSLLDQRNEMNELAKKARTDRDLLNESRRVKSEEIETHKVARDAANEVMRQHKELRNAYQDQAKALIAAKKGKAGEAAVERSLPLTVRKLRNDIQAMVEQQQTTIMSPSKEKVLVEKIRDLWLELKAKEVELKKQKSVEV
ncbi:MAG: hypothetical protein LC620_09075, partial [Halobacteriales archaeon]|nr:hypothetical protein [Halobacteriales archaeon]